MSVPGDSSPELDPALARAWREASGEEPPERLDEAIRAAARRAVHAGPQPIRRSFSQRWRLPLSIAALVVVSASITLMISERDAHLPGERAPEMHRPEAPAAPEAKRDRPAASEAQEPTAGESLDTRRSAKSAKSEEARRTDSAAEAAPAARPQPLDPARGETDQAPALAEPTEPAASARESAAAPAPAAPAATAEPTLRDEAARDAPPAPAVATPPAPAIVAPAKRGAAGAPDANGSALQKLERPSEASRFQEAESESPESQPAGRARLKMQTRPSMPAPEGGSEDALHPEQWLDRIRELRRQGLTAEADASLERFRERYPDFALPADLAPEH